MLVVATYASILDLLAELVRGRQEETIGNRWKLVLFLRIEHVRYCYGQVEHFGRCHGCNVLKLAG